LRRGGKNVIYTRGGVFKGKFSFTDKRGKLRDNKKEGISEAQEAGGEKR